jgi:tellurium resistance protein TerD
MSGIPNMKKGDVLNFRKAKPSLKKLSMRLTWDFTDVRPAFDLDATMFACNDDGSGPKLLSNADMVFFHNLQSPDGAVRHSGDSTDGKSAEDDEVIWVDFEKLSAKVNHIALAVTIYDAKARGHNFGKVNNVSLRIVDEADGQAIAEYNLAKDFTVDTGVQVGSLVKDADGNWSFVAVGLGYEKEIEDFYAAYAR